ncbi:hypothetical protein ABIB62_004638 [Mucilaginibacter sp. UYP25]|uniref:hypothetical protein n=1 Tax=unclassified Mucilaginibacter TaxID=2617802 RepID=UPI0033975E53
MREVEPTFEIEYKGSVTKVTEAEIKKRRIFHIMYANRKKPLTITIGRDNTDVKFWTSIPEGRQEEAEEVGKLIAAYIRSKKN